MTREEAITLIKAALKTMYLPKSKEYVSDLGYALEIAIKALEQEPCDDAISRQAVLKQINQWAIGNREYLPTNAMHYLTKRIQDIPPVNPQQPCGDAISRTEVIKSIDEREDVNGKVDAESVRTDIVLIPPVNTQNCDACEVGNPCLYCRHEFEPQERIGER
jgi:hypothetical protein